MRIVIAMIIVGLILVAGCLRSIGGEQYALDYVENMKRIPISPEEIEECKVGSCWCMACKNGTNIFGSMTNLIGGYCYLEKNCTQQKAGELASTKETPSISIHHFMIGQGPTFSDFSAANPYCSHRLGMAVQWLTATEETPYTLPDPSRAMCFLSKDIIPVYVLYSKGENIDIERTREIADILGTEGDDIFLGRLSDGPVGPVIVTTEMDFNVTDAAKIAEQVRVINEGCRNVRDPDNPENDKIYCFVAVAPKFNDFEALDTVMKEVGNEVDLVAYGVNGRYVNACKGGRIDPGRIKELAVNFSSYILHNWSKPSVIPYVMFDNVGTDAGGCEWDERTMQDAYSAFWPDGILSLQQKGVIGIAPYSFNATTYGVSNPLGCVDCGVGKNEQRLSTWYNQCQRYTNVTRKAPGGASTSHPSGSTPIIFPNESGGYCDHGANLDYILRGITYGSPSSRDIMNPNAPELAAPTDTYFTCDKCVAINVTGEKPFDFLPWESYPGYVDVSYACEPGFYPEVDQWAGQRNLDPMLVRAFIHVESRFDSCAAARVCSKEYKEQIGVTGTDSKGCFQPGLVDDECYNFPAYDEMYDPTETCPFQNAPPANRPDWRWCALGMMQVVQPPYTFWPEEVYPVEGEEGEHYEIYEKSGFGGHRTINFDLAKSCAIPDGEYNPFNATHSVCLGTYYMEAAFHDARIWIDNNREFLNWDPKEFEKDEVFAAYVAGHMYTGFWYSTNRSSAHPTCPTYAGNKMTNGECWARGFKEASRVDEEYCEYEGEIPLECESYGVPYQDPPRFCYGYDDFVKYVRDCEVPYLHREADPGGKRMSIYYWMIENCENSFCPEGKQFVENMCKPDEKTGDYNRDLCLSPNTPRIPESGTYYAPDLPGGG